MANGVADNGCAGAVDVTPVIVPVVGFVLIVDVLVVVCANALTVDNNKSAAIAAFSMRFS